MTLVPASSHGVSGPVNAQTGEWCYPYSSPWANNTTLGYFAAATTAIRYVPTRQFSATSIGFIITTAATANDNIDVGICDASGVRLVSSGATAGKANSLGYKTIPIAATVLTPGIAYYIVTSYGTVGLVAAIGAAMVITSGAQSAFGAAIGQVEALNMSAFTVPAQLSAASPTNITLMVCVNG